MTEKRIHVLLIEDDPNEAFLLQTMFEKMREQYTTFQVECVERLGQGIERLAKGGVDIILLNLSLPDSQGFETFSKLHAKTPSIPIVILTSLDFEALGLEAVRQGAQDYLVKGDIESNMLSRVVRYAVERHRLERIKDEFMSTVSHELRTPLSVIKASIANLKDGIVGPLSEQQAKLIDTTSRNVDRLNRIINDILDLSRLESGKARVNRHPTKCLSVIQEALHHFQKEAGEKKIVLKEEISSPLPEIYADPDLLLQVLNNLLSNALRFAKKKIVVRVKMADNGVQISVIDDGPGIPKEKIGDLFNKFVQLDRPAGAGYKGTGLGLAICKEIVDLHEGKIWVESAVGRGSQFHFILPKENHAAKI